MGDLPEGGLSLAPCSWAASGVGGGQPVHGARHSPANIAADPSCVTMAARLAQRIQHPERDMHAQDRGGARATAAPR
jgi:hypothetical protein